MRHVRLSTYVALAIVYYYTFDIAWAKEPSLTMFAYLWVRNIMLGLVFYGGWHVFLYELEAIRSKVTFPPILSRHAFDSAIIDASPQVQQALSLANPASS